MGAGAGELAVGRVPLGVSHDLDSNIFQVLP
jgi:hypothetical protein